MSNRLREIASNALNPFGCIGIADVHVLTGSSGAFYSYWEQWSKADKESFHQDIETAFSKMTTGRNDVLLISEDSHSQADSITMDLDMSAVVGMGPRRVSKHRARIGHSANFDKLLQITGYGNLFANFHLMYGRGNAANLTCMSIEDNRNSFYNVHVGGPYHATEADQATFKLVNMSEASGGDGLEHYFKSCMIGDDSVAWTNGDMIKISGTPRLVFEDCMFIMRADNAQVTFLDGTAGDGQGFILFKNSTGINLGTANTVAIGSTGLAAGTDIIIHNSGFSGATDLIAAAAEAQAKGIAQVGAAADDINIGLAIDYDHTA